MPRRLLQFETGGIYHIYNRTTERIQLFRSLEDYHFFMLRMFQYAEEMALEIMAWALLGNHYHIAVAQTNEITVSKYMHRLGTSYAKYFNHKYLRTGVLFESRFKAKLVDSEAYYLDLGHYIETNAVRHRLVKRAEDWPYSSTNFSGLELEYGASLFEDEFDDWEDFDEACKPVNRKRSGMSEKDVIRFHRKVYHKFSVIRRKGIHHKLIEPRKVKPKAVYEGDSKIVSPPG